MPRIRLPDHTHDAIGLQQLDIEPIRPLLHKTCHPRPQTLDPTEPPADLALPPQIAGPMVVDPLRNELGPALQRRRRQAEGRQDAIVRGWERGARRPHPIDVGRPVIRGVQERDCADERGHAPPTLPSPGHARPRKEHRT